MLDRKDKISNSTIPKEIYERKNLEKKLDSLLDEIDKKMKELNSELKAQKKQNRRIWRFYPKRKNCAFNGGKE